MLFFALSVIYYALKSEALFIHLYIYITEKLNYVILKTFFNI
jgi:hypothetical protein